EVEYTRDQLDRITGISQESNLCADKDAVYTYYKNGLVKTETLPDGIVNTYAYDGANRLTEIIRNDASGNRITSYQFQYDLNGNCIDIIKENVPLCEMYGKGYQYDALNRMILEVDQENSTYITYAYDDKNNMISKDISQTFNPQGNYIQTYSYTTQTTEDGKTVSRIRMTKTVDGETTAYTDYEMDLNNSIVKKTEYDGDDAVLKITDYTYDGENMLIKADVYDAETDTTQVTCFDYDALGRRLHKQREFTAEDGRRGIDGTAYIWQGDKTVRESHYSGIVREDHPSLENSETNTSINLWGIKGLLSQNDKIFTANEHGDTDMIFEDGEKIKEYEYLTAFGEELNPDEADQNAYRYCQENYDVETGLYYLRARYYDPELGRFLTEDPAQDGLNWFVYCGNNPVMFVDPWGLNIHVSGTDEQMEKFLKYTQLDTDDWIKYEGNYVIIEYEYSNGPKIHGTNMIRRLIKDENHTVYITFNDEGKFETSYRYTAGACTPGVGSSVDITIDLNNLPMVDVDNGRGGVLRETAPLEISIGHELIHALRAFGGNWKPKNIVGRYMYTKGVKPFFENVKEEELDTTGINYTSLGTGEIRYAESWDTTENALRREQGYRRRVRYYND
ncbi:MAG: hypothetical protein HFH41_13515, partial [Lachnospiraceae bacterium]|nr:hypothetical protein [Lachnospiraceae bacterium]